MGPLPLVIFHSINGIMHCDDGFAAAWVAKRGMRDAELFPGIYGQEPPLDLARGRDVYLVDFSYKREPMKALIRAAAGVLVIDHHRSAEAELSGLWRDLDGENVAAEILFDMDRSGAMLAWRHWFPDEEPPDLLLRIEDADLWRWTYDDGKAVQAALRSYPHDLDVWSDLMVRPIDDLAADGVAIRRFVEAKIRELLPNVRMIGIDGHRVEAIACPKFVGSELAGILAERGAGPFGATYEDTATGRVYSLRSRDDFDVSAVARRYGGGGHKNAAGFEVPL